MKQKKFFLICIFLSNYSFLLFSNKIFVTSIPKSGTHLLFKCINLITNKNPRIIEKDLLFNKQLENINNNSFLVCHLPYSNEIIKKLNEAKYEIFFIYRDPRDQIISHAYWIMKEPKLFNAYKQFVEFNNIYNLIDYLIQNIHIFYDYFIPWIKQEKICSIRFEDLIGPKGGGKKFIQKKQIRKIFKHLNIKFNKNKISKCINNLFGNTHTFRKGEIGEWKKYFTEKNKFEFKKIAGQLLIDLEYEKDLNW